MKEVQRNVPALGLRRLFLQQPTSGCLLEKIPHLPSSVAGEPSSGAFVHSVLYLVQAWGYTETSGRSIWRILSFEAVVKLFFIQSGDNIILVQRKLKARDILWWFGQGVWETFLQDANIRVPILRGALLYPRASSMHKDSLRGHWVCKQAIALWCGKCWTQVLGAQERHLIRHWESWKASWREWLKSCQTWSISRS